MIIKGIVIKKPKETVRLIVAIELSPNIIILKNKENTSKKNINNTSGKIENNNQVNLYRSIKKLKKTRMVIIDPIIIKGGVRNSVISRYRFNSYCESSLALINKVMSNGENTVVKNVINTEPAIFTYLIIVFLVLFIITTEFHIIGYQY